MSTKVCATGRLVAAIFACLFGITGCGSESSDRLARRSVPIAELPELVRAAAQKELPDVEFADAWKNLDKDGKLNSFEIRGRNKTGKIREVRVSATGEIIELE